MTLFSRIFQANQAKTSWIPEMVLASEAYSKSLTLYSGHGITAYIEAVNIEDGETTPLRHDSQRLKTLFEERAISGAHTINDVLGLAGYNKTGEQARRNSINSSTMKELDTMYVHKTYIDMDSLKMRYENGDFDDCRDVAEIVKGLCNIYNATGEDEVEFFLSVTTA